MKSTNNLNAKSSSTTSSNDSSFLGSFLAALINLDLFLDSTSIYTTFSSSVYPLLNSTIFDNYSLIYLIHLRELLEEGSFK
jgi:hypothetical protein